MGAHQAFVNIPSRIELASSHDMHIHTSNQSICDKIFHSTNKHIRYQQKNARCDNSMYISIPHKESSILTSLTATALVALSTPQSRNSH